MMAAALQSLFSRGYNGAVETEAHTPARRTLRDIQTHYRQGAILSMVTCYDFASAQLLDGCGIDMLLVGDSLGNTMLGFETTLPVTLEDMIRHGAAVRRGAPGAFIVVDMPYMTCQISHEEALRNAGRVMQETGCDAVKVEGGQAMAPTIRRLTDAGCPVMGHIGLTPQSIHALGGYRLQGKEDEAAERLMADAVAVQDAGAFSIVIELVEQRLSREITESLSIPTIGIGSGPGCSGQVQVLHDVLGLFPDRHLRHARRYAEVGETIRNAIRSYAEDVRTGRFP